MMKFCDLWILEFSLGLLGTYKFTCTSSGEKTQLALKITLILYQSNTGFYKLLQIYQHAQRIQFCRFWVQSSLTRKFNLIISQQGASLIAQLIKNLPAMQKTLIQFLGWEDRWRGERLPTPAFWPGESMESQRVIHDWATFTFIS